MKINYEQEFDRLHATIGLMALAERQGGNPAVGEALKGLFDLMDLIKSGEIHNG